MSKYDVNMAAHLAYVQSQKHTRGDLKRAVSAFNGVEPRGKERGVCVVSEDIKIRSAFDNPRAGNTKYFMYDNLPHRTSKLKARVMGEHRKRTK